MIRSSSRPIVTALIILLVCTAMLLPVIVLRQSQRLTATISVVDRTQKVLREVHNIITAASENESGARGFVISGNNTSNEHVLESKYLLDDGLKHLKRLLANDPEQSATIDSLEKFILYRVNFSDSMVTVRRESGIAAAIKIVESGTGNYYSDRIRQLSDDIEKGQSALLNERKYSVGRSLQMITFLLYGILAAVVLFTAILIRSALKEQRTRKENEQHFAAMLNASPDPIVISNQEGKIVMVNIQTEKLFGYSPADLNGKPLKLLIPGYSPEEHKKTRDQYTSDINSALKKHSEYEAVHKDGISFPAEVCLSLITTREGVLISASIRDISRHKRMQADLQKINAELEAFTYSVSHDLRAPLRAIIGFNTILEEEYTAKLDAEAQRITSVVKSNALRMGVLIDDLLEFSRVGRQQVLKADVNMHSLVIEVISDQMALHADAKIKWEISPLPFADADLNMIRQVLVNLISNAVKYSSRSGNPLVYIGFKTNVSETIFFVRDNGVGFDNKYRDKLFKVFQRLHSASEFEGTGVGLALVDKIIAKHGGRVWAEGQAGEGATFYFSLPLIKQTESAKSK